MPAGYIENYLKSGKKKVIDTPGRIVATKSKTGQLIPVLLEVKEFEFQGERHFIGVMSKQQQIVEEKSHLETCRQITSILLFPIVLVDQSMIIQSANSAFSETMGFEMIELIDQTVDILFNDDKVMNLLKKFTEEKKENELVGNKNSTKVLCRNNAGKLKVLYLTVNYKPGNDESEGLFMLLFNQDKI